MCDEPLGFYSSKYIVPHENYLQTIVSSSVADPHIKNAGADPGKKSRCGSGFMPSLNYGESSNSIRIL
jgi:hypothetical protein